MASLLSHGSLPSWSSALGPLGPLSSLPPFSHGPVHSEAITGVVLSLPALDSSDASGYILLLMYNKKAFSSTTPLSCHAILSFTF